MSDSAPITWFTEDPTPILIVGGLTLAVLLVMVLKTGQGMLLFIMAGVALFMGLAVLIGKLIVTDREQVKDVIYRAAASAEQNKLNEVIASISPTAPGVQAEAHRWIKQIKLDTVNITAMEVTMDRTKQPPTAMAKFKVFALGQISNNPGKYFGLITAKFRREGDRWFLTEYDHDP